MFFRRQAGTKIDDLVPIPKKQKMLEIIYTEKIKPDTQYGLARQLHNKVGDESKYKPGKHYQDFVKEMIEQDIFTKYGITNGMNQRYRKNKKRLNEMLVKSKLYQLYEKIVHKKEGIVRIGG